MLLPLAWYTYKTFCLQRVACNSGTDPIKFNVVNYGLISCSGQHKLCGHTLDCSVNVMLILIIMQFRLFSHSLNYALKRFYWNTCTQEINGVCFSALFWWWEKCLHFPFWTSRELCIWDCVFSSTVTSKDSNLQWPNSTNTIFIHYINN